jgi:hypothetical protein
MGQMLLMERLLVERERERGMEGKREVVWRKERGASDSKENSGLRRNTQYITSVQKLLAQVKFYCL